MFGFRPEPYNPRHYILEQHLDKMFKATLDRSEFSDLRCFSHSRHNQGHTSSCVAQSVVKALEIKRVMTKNPQIDLSVLAVYYLAREMMVPSETKKDEGTYVSFACDVLRRFGVCLESEFPFNDDNGNTDVFKSPTWLNMRKAYQNKITAFYRINSLGTERLALIKECLKQGHPVVFGTVVGQNWMEYKAGQVLTIPEDNVGRHATVLVGYDGNFIGENSWGCAWGNNGFYSMSPEYLRWVESSDFWVIQEGGK